MTNLENAHLPITQTAFTRDFSSLPSEAQRILNIPLAVLREQQMGGYPTPLTYAQLNNRLYDKGRPTMDYTLSIFRLGQQNNPAVFTVVDPVQGTVYTHQNSHSQISTIDLKSDSIVIKHPASHTYILTQEDRDRLLDYIRLGGSLLEINNRIINDLSLNDIEVFSPERRFVSPSLDQTQSRRTPVSFLELMHQLHNDIAKFSNLSGQPRFRDELNEILQDSSCPALPEQLYRSNPEIAERLLNWQKTTYPFAFINDYNDIVNLSQDLNLDPQLVQEVLTRIRNWDFSSTIDTFGIRQGEINAIHTNAFNTIQGINSINEILDCITRLKKGGYIFSNHDHIENLINSLPTHPTNIGSITNDFGIRDRLKNILMQPPHKA